MPRRLPSGSIGNSQIASSAAIDATKLQHQYAKQFAQVHVLALQSEAHAGNCAAPVVQQVQQVYAPQAVVVAPVVTVQPAAIVVPSAPLAVVQPVYAAPLVQRVEVQKVQKIEVKEVKQKQVVRSRTVIR